MFFFLIRILIVICSNKKVALLSSTKNIETGRFFLSKCDFIYLFIYYYYYYIKKQREKRKYKYK
jgi:hypothetical protein